VRALPDDAVATVEGVLTTNLGALEGNRSGFVQDGSGGIDLYLDAAFATPIPAGTRVRATGTVDSRFGQRTLRVAGADVAVLGVEGCRPPGREASAAAGARGSAASARGTITEAPSA
jgi:hypothetical protein